MGRFRSCLVVTYGRSGSTLLQGALNAIPGWLIRGENEHFAFHLYQAYRALQATVKAYDDAALPTHPWYGSRQIDLDATRKDIGRLIRNVLVPADRRDEVRCFGFKEIRYVFHPEVLPGFLDFLYSVLPDLGIVFNFRDIDDVLQSGWWRETDSGSTRAMIGAFERAALAYHISGNAPSFVIRYEQVLRRETALRDLFRFLGEPFDKAVLDGVLATTHSFPTETTRSS